MVLQLELFPDYPRLVPAVVEATPHPLWGAWKQFDMPEYDSKRMAESPEHADEIVRIKNALSTVLPQMPDAFVAVDSLMYLVLQNKKGVGKPVCTRLAPDVMMVRGLMERDRDSLILQKEKELLIAQYAQQNPESPPLTLEDVHLTMLTFEVMSRSNYHDKNDQYKRWEFYQRAGVQEYMVIHTREPAKRKKKELSLEFYVRQNGYLTRMLDLPEHTSQVAGIRLKIENNKLVISDLEGNIFLEYEQEIKLRKKAEKKAEEAEAKAKAEQEARLQAEAKAKTEEQARILAENRALKAEQEAEEERKAMVDLQRELSELRRVWLQNNIDENIN